MRYPAFDAEDLDPERQPVRKVRPKPLKCKQRGCRREITNDGYGEFIHADDYMYQCVVGDPRNRMATV